MSYQQTDQYKKGQRDSPHLASAVTTSCSCCCLSSKALSLALVSHESPRSSTTHTTEFVIVSDTVANATKIFSLVTKKSGLGDTMATRFLCDLVLNQKSKVQTNISSYFASYLQIYTDFCPPYFQTIKL